MEVQAGSKGRSAQHTASHGEEVWGEQWRAAAHGWTVAGRKHWTSCTYELAHPCGPISHNYRVPAANAGVVTLHLCPAPETHVLGPEECPPSIFMDGREECPQVIYRSGARRKRKTPLEISEQVQPRLLHR